MSKKWASYTFSLFLKHEMSWMDGRGIKDLHKCGEEMSKNSSIPSQEQQENKWAEWLGRGEREGDKGPKTFCPGWCLLPGQKAHVPPLTRLAVGIGTKATYCPGPKGCRDKWPGTNACFVVVSPCHEKLIRTIHFCFIFFLCTVYI